MPMFIDVYGANETIPLETGKRLGEVVASEMLDKAADALRVHGEYFVPGGALVLKPARSRVGISSASRVETAV